MESLSFHEDHKWDDIRAPQHLSFWNRLPEPKDSFFDKTPTEEFRSINISLQKLPSNHSEDDMIEPIQSPIPNPHATSTPFPVHIVRPTTTKENIKIFQFGRKNHTQPKPFSFEVRNKQLMERREERLKQIRREAEEATKFRANPIPKFLHLNPTGNKNLTITTNCRNDNDPQKSPRFKARVPKVLHVAPFQPVLPKHSLTPPKVPQLHTDIRAKERERFDNYIKEKARLDEQLQKLREAQQKRLEEEEIIKLRKNLVFKAQPIPRYPCPPKLVTKRPQAEQMTPKAAKRQRR